MYRSCKDENPVMGKWPNFDWQDNEFEISRRLLRKGAL